jgi:hypothetical protein
MYRNAWKKLRDWPHEITGAVARACMLGCTGILVHSFVDFNLQIPANAAWFYVLCVLGASPHALESHRRVRRTRQETSQDANPQSETSTPSA